MRSLTVFRRSMLEQIRSPWVLVLVVLTAPFFVFLFWMIYQNYAAYSVAIVNLDQGVVQPDGSKVNHGAALIERISNSDTGSTPLTVTLAGSRREAESMVRSRTRMALLVVPPSFSSRLEDLKAGESSDSEPLILSGDLTNPQYVVSSILVWEAVDSYTQNLIPVEPTVAFHEEPLGLSGARSDFEASVPALLVMSVIMMIYQASMVVAAEVEKGTLTRLRLTPMTGFDYFAGLTLTQLVIGSAVVALTLLSAQVLGFRSAGPIWVAFLVGALTLVGVVGIGLLVACFSKTTTEAFIYANFPLFLLFFFTGGTFPVPQIPLFTIAGVNVKLFDLLPTTHGVVALGKVLTLGASLEEVAGDLLAMTALSAGFLFAGVWAMNRIHLRKQD